MQAAKKSEKVFVVGLTGGGLYKSGHDHSSAALLRDAMPDRLTRASKPDILILKYPRDVPPVYGAVRDIVPTLWNGNLANWDTKAAAADKVVIHLMIHMGMRAREDDMCFETVARRDSYIHSDMDGEEQPDGEERPGGFFEGCPSELSTDLPIQEITEDILANVPDAKVRLSTNAGHNLCEYMFYSSLAEKHRRNETKNVAFIHVPPGSGKENVEDNVEVLSAFIRSATVWVEAHTLGLV